MTTLETEHVFNASLDKTFGAISQYALYSKYLPGVTATEVLKAIAAKSVCQVRYELNIVKKFYYTLDMFEDEPQKIWWQLADSNLFKENAGSWEFSTAGKNKTRAIYRLDVQFRGLVPRMITDPIAKSNVPLMMSGFQKLIDEFQTI